MVALKYFYRNSIRTNFIQPISLHQKLDKLSKIVCAERLKQLYDFKHGKYTSH
jgi:hypothetical protein